jgi:hypothetical protein
VSSGKNAVIATTLPCNMKLWINADYILGLEPYNEMM